MQVNQFVDPSIISQLRNEPSQNYIQWPNIMVTAKSNRYYKQIPESALSVFTNKKGNANIHLKGQKRRICEEIFMLVNPFENFEYEIKEEVFCQNIHFEWDFFQNVTNTLLSDDDELLEYPNKSLTGDLVMSQLHFKDEELQTVLKTYDKDDEQSFFMDVLTVLLQRDDNTKKQISKVPSKKQSTKKELFQRMILAKDMIFSCYDNAKFSISQISDAVAMSHFHFLRVFKQVYGLSPGKMLKHIRLERARFLLKNSELPVNEIAMKVGFEESNSIYPLLKKQLHTTPMQYREISNFQ